MNHEYHISMNGSDENIGSVEFPFRTISKAAETAKYNDIITVHEGTYREWINPKFGGRDNIRRIIYRAAAGEKVVLKGSEIIGNWDLLKENIWKAEVSNALFGNYNPYAQELNGDWLLSPKEPYLHSGMIYLNEKALKEVFSVSEVANTAHSWYAEVNEKQTVFYANFANQNPNECTIEANVRKCCFYPEKSVINYITIQGFEIAHAASPWAPPTAEQFAMLGTHGGKGWIIEDNVMHDARCSAVSLGIDPPESNKSTLYRDKSGYQYQIETVFKAKSMGWDKGKVGSHIVRNNTIYNCGQNGIVGHMGSAFSEIYGNHIYYIGNAEEFMGWEIAGIKFHAAIDTYIHDNYIHDCGRFGIWLDWQTQGVRVSKNILCRNGGSQKFNDLFVEVSHGPYLVDNNIFASERNLQIVSQGGAYVHNLLAGAIHPSPCMDRATPYHFNHTTDIAGYAFVYGNDVRFYQNIFAGTGEEIHDWKIGTAVYNGNSVSMEEYIDNLDKSMGDHEKYYVAKQPVYIDRNCYFGNSAAFDREENKLVMNTNVGLQITEEDDKVYLELDIPEEFFSVPTTMITTDNLQPPRIVDLPYEHPDGTPLRLDFDLFGNRRADSPTVGPIESLQPGHNKILIWQIK